MNVRLLQVHKHIENSLGMLVWVQDYQTYVWDLSNVEFLGDKK